MIRMLNLLIVTCLSFIFVGYTYFLGENILDPGDGIKHFQIAKYSWDYPSLLLHHWGKPLFTLLSSPFAQLGFNGMIFFNILLFVVCAVFILKIAQQLSLKYGWLERWL